MRDSNVQRFLFSTPSGRVAANVIDDGDTLIILGIGSASSRDLKRKLGVAGMRRILRTLAVKFPNAKVAAGNRVSGSKRGPAAKPARHYNDGGVIPATATFDLEQLRNR